MGLDICRFIEIKRDGKWSRLKWGKELVTNSDEDASHFNNGKGILECWLETSNLVNDGIPEDTDSEYVYKDWGYKTQWATLQSLEQSYEDFEHLLHKNLKLSVSNKKLDEILRILKKEPEEEKSDNFYEDFQVYPWNDYEIKDEFDDTYAMGIWKLTSLKEDICTAKGIIEACIQNGEYISTEDIRIIFVYNR